MRSLVASIVWLLLMSSPLSAGAAEPITIGLSLGLSGRYAEMSRMQEKSFTLWEREVNSRGGILGRKIELIIYDNKSDPRTAKSLYEHLIIQDKVDLLFSPYSSELTEAILPVTEEYGYPIIASGASGDVLWNKGYKYFFGLYSVASKYTAGFLALLVQQGFETIAIVYADDSFSTGIADGTKKFAEKFGLKVLLFSGFKKGTKNFEELIKKAKNSRAQVLMVCGYFEEAIDVRLALNQIGWYPKVYYAAVGPALQAYGKLGSDADYTFSSSQWERYGKLPGSEAFYKEFLKTYGEEPSYHAADAYAAGQILERAIKKTGSLDREKIRAILSVMQTTTIIGRYGVDKTGKQVKHFPLIVQWQKGKKEIVWPKDLSTAKPIFK